MVDEIPSDIPRKIAPLVGLIACGDLRPDGYFPMYKQDGSLWFVMDPNLNIIGKKKAERPDPALLHAKADQSETRSLCYFIGGSTGPVKIGHSIDPDSRCAGFQCGSPISLSVLAIVPGGQLREVAYHAQFASARSHGEWFKRTPALRSEIRRINKEAVA